MSITAIILWLVIGGIIGWLASLIMRTDAQQGIILNIVVGIVGSLIAGFFFHPSGALEGFLYSLLGSIILLAIVILIRRVLVR